MVNFALYTSPCGLYEARLPKDNKPRLRLFEALLASDEAGLNRHMSDAHLGQPGAMKNYGFRFDGELARFLGLRLDAVAEETAHTIRAIQEGTFGKTEAYRKITTLHLSLGEVAADAIRRMTEYEYDQLIAAELGTLAQLSVINTEIITTEVRAVIGATTVQPNTTDSFFRRFGIVAA